ncbi:MAG: T9SS type A sorting domain-containing protein [Bacteroidia bacterium]|nr:T9SS type A sorting domain-containing protein [Bacteroidia bacterium]
MRKIYIPLVVWILTMVSVFGKVEARNDKGNELLSNTDATTQVARTTNTYVSNLANFPFNLFDHTISPLRASESMMMGPVDAGVSDIISPQAVQCFSANTEISVEVTNYGTATLDFSVDQLTLSAVLSGSNTGTYTSTVSTGTLAPNAVDTFTITMMGAFTQAGVTDIQAYTSMTQDTVPSNDTTLASYTVNTSVGTGITKVTFDSYTGGNLNATFPQWDEANGGTSPTVGGSSWTGKDFLNQTNANGTSASINIYSNFFDGEWLLGPIVTATANTELTYDIGVTAWNSPGSSAMGSDDTVAVYISTDCGASFTLLRAYTVLDNILNVLTPQSISLAAYAGQDIVIGFRAEDGPVNDPEDYDFFIDNINIKESIPVDFEAQAILSPTQATFGCPNPNTTVTLRVSNVGNAAINLATDPLTANVDITGPVAGSFNATLNTGTLPIGSTVDVVITTTANLGNGGLYTLNCYTTSAADGNSANDSISTTINAPLSVGNSITPVTFDGFTGFNLNANFPQWDEGNGPSTAAPVIGGSSWTAKDFTNQTTVNGTAAAINLYSDFLDGEWLVGPLVTAAANSELSFDIAVTAWNATGSSAMGSDDTVAVFISTDCGVSYTMVRSYTVLDAIPNTQVSQSISLAPYAGQDIIIAFRADDGTVDDPEDYDFFIDNINVRQVLPTDAQTNAVVAPTTPGCLTNMEDVILQIENVGNSPINLSADTLKLTADITGPIPQTLSQNFTAGTLPAGGTVDLVVGSGDFSIPGTYTVTGYLSITSDVILSNDTVVAVIVNDSSVGGTFPPVDFGGYTGSNLNAQFPLWYEWDGQGQPTQRDPFSDWTRDDFGNDPGSPNGDAARLNVWSTGNFGWIIGPKFTPDSNSVLTYDYALTTFSGTASSTLGTDDSVGVYVSTDCGASFALVRLYDANSTLSNTGDTDTLDLNPYAGQDIIVGFYASSGSVNDPQDNNFYLDNINVTVLTVGDKALGEFKAPPAVDLSCGGATQPVVVSVQNAGSGTLDFSTDSVTVFLDITNPDATVQSYSSTVNSGTLASLASIDITVTPTADFSQTGTYDFEAYITSPEDTVASNDTIRTSRISIPSSGTSLPVVTFDGYTNGNLPAISGGWSEWTGAGRPETENQAADWVRDDYNNNAANPNGDAAKVNLWNLGTNSWMVSPKFTITSQTLLFYDIAITDFASTTPATFLGSDDTVGVYISVDCGLTWTSLILYTDSLTIPAGGQTDTINLGATYAGQDAIVAFYGTEGTIDDPQDNDIFIDNINISEFYDNDLSAAGFLLEPNGACGDSMTFGELVLSNLGFNDQNEVPWEVLVESSTGMIWSFVDTLRGTPALASGASDTVTFGPFNTFGGGDYTITAVSQFGTDENTGNDTLVATINFSSRLAPEVDPFDPVCSGETATLNIVDPRGAGVNYQWSVISGMDTTVVDTGDAYTTPALTMSTTYLIEEIQDTLSGGAPDNTIGGGGAFTSDAGLIFDALTTFTLESVTVYPSDTGSVVIGVLDSDGNVVAATQVTLTVTTGPQVVDLGFTIPAGTGYAIVTPAPTRGMYRNNSGAVYPYTLPGVFSITETANGLGTSGFYYFYYNWVVTVPLCNREVGSVTVDVKDSTVSSFSATDLDDNEVDIMNLATGADSVKYLFGDGDSSTTASGTHTYPGPGNYTITQIAYGDCNNDTTIQKIDVTCTAPTAGYTWVLDPSDPDGLTVVFTSTATRDDSVSYELLPGTNSDVPSFSFAFPGTDDYVVSMTVFNVCDTVTFTDTLNIIQVGLENVLDVSSLKLYPNPTRAKFQLDFNLLQVTDVNIEVVDMRGKLMAREIISNASGNISQSFELSDAADGIYLVKVMIGNEIVIRKIQIE